MNFEPRESSASGKGTASSARVVVVDDQAAVRRLIRRILERAGHQVLEAEDGVDALEKVAAVEGGIDLLITDLMMPRLDGPSLAAKLRETFPALPVIYTSGQSPDKVSDEEREDRHTDFLQKPFREAELVGMLGELLDESPAA